MHPRVLKAYKEWGYDVHVGNNKSFASALTDRGRVIRTGGGMSIEDIVFFSYLSSIWKPSAIYLIGNAFGYSSLNIAASFPDAIIDVIDAEIEGEENVGGSNITRQIADKYFKNLKLYIGRSPEDLKVCRREDDQVYGLGVVDGFHQPEQMVKDFRGLKEYLEDQALIYFHDAGTYDLYPHIEALQKLYSSEGWEYYKLEFVPFGAAVLIRNLEEVTDWIQMLQPPASAWKNPIPAIKTHNDSEFIKAIFYNGSIYNPTLEQLVFCEKDPQANYLRLLIETYRNETIAIYGARGSLAEKVVDLISNYRDRNIVFIDRGMVGKSVSNWPVFGFDDVGDVFVPDVYVVAAEVSGPSIMQFLDESGVQEPIFPLFDTSDPVWRTLAENYPKRASEIIKEISIVD